MYLLVRTYADAGALGICMSIMYPGVCWVKNHGSSCYSDHSSIPLLTRRSTRRSTREIFSKTDLLYTIVCPVAQDDRVLYSWPWPLIYVLYVWNYCKGILPVFLGEGFTLKSPPTIQHTGARDYCTRPTYIQQNGS